MADLNDLIPFFAGGYSIRFRPSHSSLHLDVPELENNNFDQINSILKTAAEDAPLSLTLSFRNTKHVTLTIHSQTQSITIEKLRPMYGMKEKLEKSNPEMVELCLFNYQHSGIYIGTKFKLKLEK